MAEEVKNKIKKQLSRKYLSKDFVGLRNELLNHVKIYFPDNIRDFSEASMGGLFLEMAAYIGDNLSYYLDHQFNELDYAKSIEIKNLEQHIKNAGVKITGNSPASLDVRFYLKVPAKYENGIYSPDPSCLPIIQKGSVISTSVGVSFELTHNIDFAQLDEYGELTATVVEGRSNSGTPSHFFLYQSGLCVSGTTTTETFSISNVDVPFRTISLGNGHVTSIDRVSDAEGNEYYEVESLSQDTVFIAVANDKFSNDGVRFNLQVKPANHRYITSTSINTRSTTIGFGSGSPDSLEDDIIADPSVLALPLYGRTTLTKFSIDPSMILRSKTLGVYPKNTTISVVYRYGGGASHNVSVGSAKNVTPLRIVYPSNITLENKNNVTNSLDVKNITPGRGGANAPKTNELRALIPASRNMQNRVVTRQDLLARLYSLPAEFGRIFRASIVNNPNNPLASILYVISKDGRGNLTMSPDSLKRNLSVYLNEFRLISDAIDIVDADVVNYKISLSVTPTPGVNTKDVANTLITQLKSVTSLPNYQIGTPIIEADIINTIINTVGVLSLNKLEFINISGDIHGREYSQTVYNFSANKKNGMYFIKQNSIFELRHPSHDIEVTI